MCIKLMMNTIYGKTCMTRCDNLVSLATAEEARIAISKKFGLFKQVFTFGNGHSLIEFACYNKSYVKNHIGAMILEMSKRIINEALDIAQDNSMVMLYTDTDSLHMFKKDIPLLCEMYFEKYQRELVGSDLGQFHCDFAPLKCGHANPVSVKFVMLAPKVYCDELKCHCGLTGTHAKMKGIPQFAIAAKKCGSVFGLYEYMCQGHEVKYNLNPPSKVRFSLRIGAVRTLLPNCFVHSVQV